MTVMNDDDKVTPITKSQDVRPLPFADMSRWSVDHPPQRQWGVHDRFPLKNVALFSGEGAAGKTLLLLQLGVAHVLGRDWMGTLPRPGPFLYFGAEDDDDEMHRRLADILKHCGVDFPDLQGNLHLLTLVGEDAVLGAPDRDGLIRPTSLFARLMKAVNDIKPVLIGIDTSADVFAGDESNRAQVRQFVGMLRKMAIQANGYVILNSHPSVTGIKNDSGLSGSTGWHNSVRARAYLTSPKTKDGDELDTSLRLLQFKKSNYGPISRSMTLRWENGVYKPVAGIGSLDKLVAAQHVDAIFLQLLQRFEVEGRDVSAKPSPLYAPKLFALEREADGIEDKALGASMRRLFKAKKIQVVTDGPPSRRRQRLMMVDVP
jgi:RecA-family ATPase